MGGCASILRSAGRQSVLRKRAGLPSQLPVSDYSNFFLFHFVDVLAKLVLLERVR